MFDRLTWKTSINITDIKSVLIRYQIILLYENFILIVKKQHTKKAKIYHKSHDHENNLLHVYGINQKS